MKLHKLNFYLLIQISKYFFLILFIFLSVAWLLQLTRLFTISNFMNIEILNIIFLSFYLIPNIITVILPFILIFALLLCFIKLHKDNELIAILSLGKELNHFKKVFLIFTFSLVIIFSILNFYLAPKIYEQYKIIEYDLRNNLNFNNMAYSNFLNLNKSTILDFNKIDNSYEDIFISFKDKKDNLFYARKGNIFNENNQYKFQLIDGFKISIDEKEQIEKLEFLNYVLKIENQNINIGKIIDKNTLTIFDDIKEENYINIVYKIFDIILIFYVIFLFYYNNLVNIGFNTQNNIFYSFLCIFTLILNQILKNSEIILLNYILILLTTIFFSLIITYLKLKYEQN